MRSIIRCKEPAATGELVGRRHARDRCRNPSTNPPARHEGPGAALRVVVGLLTSYFRTMIYRALADLVLLTHFAFVLFVILGGLLALRWRRVAWVHVPVALYGALIEFVGFVCPLTPLEVSLRRRGGEAGYEGGFIDHYVAAAIYPEGLTREIQLVLGACVLLLNAAVYAMLARRHRREGRMASGAT